MKTSASLFLLCLSLAELTAAPVNPDLYTHPVRVACVGDSITQGVGADPGHAYPSQLQALLGSGWEVKNFGVSGRTLLRKGDFPYWKEDAFKSSQDYQPDVVIIMLGTNDTKPQNWAHASEFAQDYHDLVQTYQNLLSRPRVYVCRPTPVPGTGNYGIAETNIRLEIPIVDALASSLHTGVIDMHAALLDHPELLPDHVHPNTEGAGDMAKAAFAGLTGRPAPAGPAMK